MSSKSSTSLARTPFFCCHADTTRCVPAPKTCWVISSCGTDDPDCSRIWWSFPTSTPDAPTEILAPITPPEQRQRVDVIPTMTLQHPCGGVEGVSLDVRHARRDLPSVARSSE